MLLILIAAFTGCGGKGEKEKKQSMSKKGDTLIDSNSSLTKYDFKSNEVQAISLPNELKEISGIAVSNDGRLFANQDESAMVYEIDPATGAVIKRFSVGAPALKGDFEDIEIAGNKFFLVSSKGDIYEFSEAQDGQSAEYKLYETPLSHSYDVEGLCFDPVSNSLLLACKGYPGEDITGAKSIYRFDLTEHKLIGKPHFVIDQSVAGKNFDPSGIIRNPSTGSFYVISSTGNAIVELSDEGKIIGKAVLPSKVHEQPEGVAFFDGGTLLISNEGRSGKGYIIKYTSK